MCGLFGWSFSRQPNKTTMKALAISLMLQNDNRGGDSWGWFAPKSNSKRVGIGNITGMKRSVLAHMISEPVLIGHTRKATTGSITKQNCHPFDVGTIVGAHNGIVYNHDELNRRFNRNCTVDSEHIFHHFEENEDLQDIEAYGAVLMHVRNHPENPVYFGTFNNGDLSFCRVDGGIIWSSSKWHLRAALQLSGLSANVEEPKEGILYSTVGTANGVTECMDLDISKPNYVSSGDWRATGGCGYRAWYQEDDEPEDKRGYYWSSIEGKFVPYSNKTETPEQPKPDSSTDSIHEYDADEVNLHELTEKDMQDLANAADSDTFSLVHLNEHFEEENSKPIKLILPD